MANERFKVKFGLAVGDTAATIDATTGDIVTNGDIQLGGNDIKSSTGVTAITLNAFDVNVAGDLTVSGNDIRSSGGTVALTLSGTNVTVAGDLAVNGGDITTTQTTANIVNATATTVNLAGAATTVSIGADTGTTTINNSLVADDISVLTVDTTNLEVTNLKAKDGTQAATITDGTGAINVTSSLQVDNIDIRDNTISSTNTDGNINIIPNGTGDVYLTTDVVYVGDANTTAFISTNGTGNLVLNTNANVNSGNITIAQGVDGNISIVPNGAGRTAVTQLSTTSPRITTSIDDANGNELLLLTATGSAVNELTLANAATGNSPTITASGADSNVGINIVAKGTGNIALNTNDGGNAVVSRNYVKGAIRNANTQARGNIWELLATTPPTTPTQQFTGISIDNSGVETTKLAGAVLRNYGSLGPQRPRLIFERARGTAAAPARVQLGDLLGEVDATGYYDNLAGTAGWINDNLALVPAFYGFVAAETWTSTSNLGTSFTISLQPTGTLLAAGSQIPVVAANPQNLGLRSDAMSMYQGKTASATITASIAGTTMTVTAVASGTLTPGQFLTNLTTTVLPNMYIVSQLTGTTGSTGTYQVSRAQTLASGTITAHKGFLQLDTALSFMSADTISLQNSTGSQMLSLDANEALFSRTIRNKITTATVAQGGTYTPAVSALNSIILEVTAGSGTTTIDVSDLTVAGENAVFDILVYNNSGGSINANGFVILNGGNTVLDHGASIADGARAMFEINCVDIYANAQFVGDAV